MNDKKCPFGLARSIQRGILSLSAQPQFQSLSLSFPKANPTSVEAVTRVLYDHAAASEGLVREAGRGRRQEGRVDAYVVVEILACRHDDGDSQDVDVIVLGLHRGGERENLS